MSLLTGFHEPVLPPRDPPGVVKTFTKTMTLTKYDDKVVVKNFDSGILLTGITTASASADPSTPHVGIVYYDIYTPDLSKRVSDVRTDSGNYFTILNKNNVDDTVGRLLAVYNVPKPCSLTIRLAAGSSRKKRGNTETNRPSLKSGPIGPVNPVTLNVTMYYAEITAHVFADNSGGVLAM